MTCIQEKGRRSKKIDLVQIKALHNGKPVDVLELRIRGAAVVGIALEARNYTILKPCEVCKSVVCTGLNHSP